MACFNDTHNWQTISHRSFSGRYSGLVTKAIDGVPVSLMGDILASPPSVTLTSRPQRCQIQVPVIDNWLMFHVTVVGLIGRVSKYFSKGEEVKTCSDFTGALLYVYEAFVNAVSNRVVGYSVLKTQDHVITNITADSCSN
jgi:hypothetical protein